MQISKGIQLKRNPQRESFCIMNPYAKECFVHWIFVVDLTGAGAAHQTCSWVLFVFKAVEDKQELNQVRPSARPFTSFHLVI